MILVLEGSQRRQLGYYFDRMFRLRHQVFIKELGWNLPKAFTDARSTNMTSMRLSICST